MHERGVGEGRERSSVSSDPDQGGFVKERIQVLVPPRLWGGGGGGTERSGMLASGPGFEKDPAAGYFDRAQSSHRCSTARPDSVLVVLQ